MTEYDKYNTILKMYNYQIIRKETLEKLRGGNRKRQADTEKLIVPHNIFKRFYKVSTISHINKKILDRTL